MIFWLILSIFIISLIFVILEAVSNKIFDDATVADVVCGISGCFLGVFLIFILTSYFEKDATCAKFTQTRRSLQYQLDMGVYEPLATNENFDNSEKIRLYSKVEEFNKELGSYQAMHNNFWVGIFYQANLNDIDYIEYPDRESWLDRADGVKKI